MGGAGVPRSGEGETPMFVAGRITDIDARRTLTPAEVARIEAAMDAHAVTILPGQDIDDSQQLAFTRNFGELEDGANSGARDQDLRLPVAFADVSNLDRDGRIAQRENKKRMAALANRLWHTDASFRVNGAKYSILSGRVVPAEGPDTEFADMRAAYDALDARSKAEIEDLVCEHSLLYSRGALGFTEFLPNERVAMKPVRQRLVRVHPVTGRKSLYLASHIGAIVGWPRPEAMAFIRDLIEHATQPQFVYVHKWKPHDLVMWDNRATMHRVRRFDDLHVVRDVRRTTVRGDAPTAQQEAA
jgi:alpha-ketoglutarate-dependent 2,4-dichlorophenoxyacetate dioxygenase